jgi:hypothetical protein
MNNRAALRCAALASLSVALGCGTGIPYRDGDLRPDGGGSPTHGGGSGGRTGPSAGDDAQAPDGAAVEDEGGAGSSSGSSGGGSASSGSSSGGRSSGSGSGSGSSSGGSSGSSSGGGIDNQPDAGPPGATMDLTPTKDAYVQDGPYVNTNFSADPTLAVKMRSVAGYNRNSWLSFDISNVSNVTSAKLRLYVQSLETTLMTTVPTVVYYPPDSTDDWAPATLSWSNAPPSGTEVLCTVNVDNPQIGTWIEFDVTAAVAADSDGTATFMVTSMPVDRLVVFSSSRGANPPVLRVVSGGGAM